MGLSFLETDDYEYIDHKKTPFLDRYTENLTEKISRNVANYRVIGREKEVEEVITSLLRKSKNAPLLVGEAGVGKTAILEGLVVRIIQKRVPERLRSVTIRSLELSTIMNEQDGGFISKFKGIIEEMAETYGENLLFIDEIHTLVGAGGAGTALDAGNIIKPVLARGEIQIVGATTTDEYHAFIEKDRALQRRFQLVYIDEPNEEKGIQILEGAKTNYEQFHEVTIKKEAVEAAVKLSVRYIPDRFLPDKAFDLLDEATTRAANAGEKQIGEREVAEVLKIRTGIPVTTILQDEADRLEQIEARLTKRVKGQQEAVRELADAITIAKAGLQDESKPISTFLLLGPTGVGKTELAKALAEVMFDEEQAMIRFDMSEFSQEGASLKLIGNETQTGQLTEAVKHKPYAIVLFDEIEKAARETHDLLLQIMDDGRLTDGTGRLVSFKNTIVILTTNIGAELIKTTYDLKSDDLDERGKQQFLLGIDNELFSVFRPEFVNRIDHKVVFKMLGPDVIKEIAVKNLDLLADRLGKQHASLSYEPEVLDYLSDVGTDRKNGARPLARLITQKVLAPIAHLLLEQPQSSVHFHISVKGEAPKSHELQEKRQLVFDVRSRSSEKGKARKKQKNERVL